MLHFSDVIRNFYSEKELSKIKSKRIGIAGTGGLGSNCSLALVRSGFEKFVIVDFDVVSISNLNRQQYFWEDIGKPKVECLAATLNKLNPSLDCLALQEKITDKNAEKLFETCDCIIEAFDNSESKAMIVSKFIESSKLIVSVSGLGGYGMADRIITRKIRENFFLIGDGVSEVGADIKPYAPCVMIAAAKQADVVLEWAIKSE